MSTFGYKGNVATKPFEKKAVEVRIKNGVGLIDQKTSLEGLEVVFGDGQAIEPADTVWVRPDGVKSWGKDEFEILGQKVVICEPRFIILVTKKAPVTRASVPGY